MARSNFIIKKKIKSVEVSGDKRIKSIYHNKHRYGYRRITDELNNQGMVINHKTVLRLMKLLLKVSLD
jgi:hypothetical protein